MDNTEAIKVIRSNWPHGRVMLTEACELSIKALEAMDAVDNSAQQLKPKMPLLEEVESYTIDMAKNDINNLGPMLTGAQLAYDYITRHFGH